MGRAVKAQRSECWRGSIRAASTGCAPPSLNLRGGWSPQTAPRLPTSGAASSPPKPDRVDIELARDWSPQAQDSRRVVHWIDRDAIYAL
jgi:hypothetical protein